MNRDYLSKNSINPYFAASGVEPEDLRNIFLNNFVSLPESIQKLILGEETEEKIANLSELYNLDVAQTELISWTIRNVASGSFFIKELPEIIFRVADMSKEKASEISNYIIKEIFAPALEDIKQIQKEKFSDRIRARQETPPVSVSRPVVPPQQAQPTVSSPPIKPPAYKRPLPNVPEDLSGNIVDLRK